MMVKEKKRTIISFYLLSFFIFWMSTWMMTDIHASFLVEQSHPIFSQPSTDHLSEHLFHELESSCNNICSDDHGGHMGKSLPTSTIAFLFFSISVVQCQYYLRFWHSSLILPQLRPPIES